eukprot:jgi/Ulvmu1/10842/UM007_0016.1
MTDQPLPQRFSGAAPTGNELVQSGALPPKRIVRQQIPDHILQNTALQEAIGVIPANYNFEIVKTVWRIREAGAKRVALQFPEGLLMYSCIISDILCDFADVDDTMILGDVTYGACCVDDFTAHEMGAEFLVHYGHSCLVPVTVTKMPCMYVFVDIQMDLDHLLDTVELNFKPEQRLVLAGTIQFATSIQNAKLELAQRGFKHLLIPQERPLSAGETLGCTAPRLAEPADALVFVADGRFHLEAMLIANPSLRAYRYDPYGRVLTEEQYDQHGMRAVRRAAVERARSAQVWGLVLGTLGRQGSPALLRRLEALFSNAGLEYFVVLMSEVTPQNLALMPTVEAWVQIACPRLSIDWGEAFDKPTLTPYEAMVCLGAAPPWWDEKPDENGVHPYPMDYYAREGGQWNSSYHKARPPRPRPVAAVASCTADAGACAAPVANCGCEGK